MRDHLDAVARRARACSTTTASPSEWLARRCSALADRDDLHGLLAGRLTRLLLDAGRLDAPAVRDRGWGWC